MSPWPSKAHQRALRWEVCRASAAHALLAQGGGMVAEIRNPLGTKKTGDPLVNIQKTSKNHGKSPFSSWVKQNYFYGHVQKRC
jgi:hypothetical protein